MKEKTGTMIGCAMLSYVSLYAVQKMLKSAGDMYVISNSIFSILLFVGLTCFFLRFIPRINRRLMIISSVIGLFFSFCMVVGSNVLVYEATQLNHATIWIAIICGVPLFMTLVALCIEYTGKTGDWIDAIVSRIKCLRKVKDRERHLSGKKYFLLVWALIFIAWIPGLIATYPGVYGYDAVYQMNHYTWGEILLQHPLAHTYYLGFCVYTVGNWLGNRQLGMLLYSLTQMLILSAIFAIICNYMKRKKVGFGLRFIVLLFFMFFPTNVILSFSSTKDVLYSGFFALMILGMFEVTNHPEILKKKRVLISIVAVIFLQMIFRSQGRYVFLFGMLFGFILLRKEWKKLLLFTVIVFAIFGIYSGPFTKLCHGAKFDSLREMMSVPCVQLSRTAIYNADELTADEMDKIQDYIPRWNEYTEFPSNADALKNEFNTELFRENPMAFVKLWASVGIKSPMSYIDAFARITIGLWYPDMNYRDMGAWHPYWEYNNTEQNADGSYIIVERSVPRCLQWLASIYSHFANGSAYQRLPVVAVFFSSGLLIWLIVIYIGWCIYRAKYQMLFPVSFMVGLWLTLLLGPVILYRYVYPLVVSIPLLITNIIAEEKHCVKDKDNIG